MQELKRVLFGLAGFLPVALTQAAEVQRPNFIVILADDMGVTDIGAFHELYPGAQNRN